MRRAIVPRAPSVLRANNYCNNIITVIVFIAPRVLLYADSYRLSLSPAAPTALPPATLAARQRRLPLARRRFIRRRIKKNESKRHTFVACLPSAAYECGQTRRTARRAPTPYGQNTGTSRGTAAAGVGRVMTRER